MRYVLDFGPGSTGTPSFTVFRSLADGQDVAPPALGALDAAGVIEFDYTPTEAIYFRAELGTRFISGSIDPRTDFPMGDGSVAVDHDHGGTDAMRIMDLDRGVPIEEAFLYAYLASDWNAGRRSKKSYAKGWTLTTNDGRWHEPIFLDPGSYKLVVSKTGFRTVVLDLEVAADA